ncbi:hypothetical protein FQA39_LY19427 [Lamprigera yunnana]|nr:hypothetical protein FQA39_LY19427 [Lamprigera yunnana]
MEVSVGVIDFKGETIVLGITEIVPTNDVLRLMKLNMKELSEENLLQQELMKKPQKKSGEIAKRAYNSLGNGVSRSEDGDEAGPPPRQQGRHRQDPARRGHALLPTAPPVDIISTPTAVRSYEHRPSSRPTAAGSANGAGIRTRKESSFTVKACRTVTASTSRGANGLCRGDQEAHRELRQSDAEGGDPARDHPQRKGKKKLRALKRLKVVAAFQQSDRGQAQGAPASTGHPFWMVMTVSMADVLRSPSKKDILDRYGGAGATYSSASMPRCSHLGERRDALVEHLEGRDRRGWRKAIDDFIPEDTDHHDPESSAATET